MTKAQLNPFHRRLVVALVKNQYDTTRALVLRESVRVKICKEVGGGSSYLDRALSWGKSADDVGDPLIIRLASVILHYDWSRFERDFPDPFDGRLKGKKFHTLDKLYQLRIEEEIDFYLRKSQPPPVMASDQKEAKKSALRRAIEDWIQINQAKLVPRELNFSLVASPIVMSRDGHPRTLDFMLRIEGATHDATAGILLWEDGDEIPSEMMDQLRLLIEDRSFKSFMVITNHRRESKWLSRHDVQCYPFEDVTYLIRLNHVFGGKIPQSNTRIVPPFKFHGGDQIAQAIFNTFLKPIPLDGVTRSFLRELFGFEAEIGIWMIAMVFDSLQLDWITFRSQIFAEIQKHSPKSNFLQLLTPKE